MSEIDDETPGGASAETPMRRRLLGYKRADVEAALEARESELGELESEIDARDAELGELRQDIAALWLAFAQHDRMLGELRRAIGAPASATAETGARPEPEAAVRAKPANAPSGADPSVGRQLADLDEVLAAIEMATQTLEQTYADEIEESEGEPEGERSGED